jgi:nicotinamide mononucleotide transporter
VSTLELLAVIVSILGVWLTTKQSIWNFPFSVASVAIYAVIFFKVKLYADAALQVFFGGTLLYGFTQWNRERSSQGELIIARVITRDLFAAIVFGALASVAVGFLFAHRSDASLPWIDSPLLVASLIGTFWNSRRFVEQWWVWIAVDTIYSILYAYKQLYLTSFLYAVFVLLAIHGLRQWRSNFFRQLRPTSLLL